MAPPSVRPGQGRRDLVRVLAPTQLLGAIGLGAAEVADDQNVCA
jgi:hypothetical protein